MHNEILYQHLEQILPLSSAIKAYLNVALKESTFKKNEIIPNDFFIEHPLVFVSNGHVKTKLESLKEPGQRVVKFHFQHHLIPQNANINPDDFLQQRISIDDSILTVLPVKHEFNLYKLFPEYHMLIYKIHEYQLGKLLHNIYQLQFEEGQTRLDHLLTIEPKLFQFASVQDISSAIGVHPHTLSTYIR